MTDLSEEEWIGASEDGGKGPMAKVGFLPPRKTRIDRFFRLLRLSLWFYGCEGAKHNFL